jgi:hypothetical protein
MTSGRRSRTSRVSSVAAAAAEPKDTRAEERVLHHLSDEGASGQVLGGSQVLRTHLGGPAVERARDITQIPRAAFKLPRGVLIEPEQGLEGARRVRRALQAQLDRPHRSTFASGALDPHGAGVEIQFMRCERGYAELVPVDALPDSLCDCIAESAGELLVKLGRSVLPLVDRFDPLRLIRRRRGGLASKIALIRFLRRRRRFHVIERRQPERLVNGLRQIHRLRGVAPPEGEEREPSWVLVALQLGYERTGDPGDPIGLEMLDVARRRKPPRTDALAMLATERVAHHLAEDLAWIELIAAPR